MIPVTKTDTNERALVEAATLLFYLQGLSYAEAATLGIAVSALKARLHKSRLTLRAQLQDLWKEDSMGTQTDDQLVEARVLDVRRPPLEGDAPAQHIVVLETADGAYRLPIWVGRAEAEAMALQLTGTQMPRPLTFSFFADLLTGLGDPLREVCINRLADGVFYATAVLETARGLQLVDARPSDALNLALTTGAPIRVD